MGDELLPRMGTFFIVVSLGLLVLFIASIFSHSMQLGYFLVSAVTFFIGTLLRRRKKPYETKRFERYRRYRAGRRKGHEGHEHQEKEHQKEHGKD